MSVSFQARLLQHLSRRQTEVGFTLVELLVVVVIIGILSAISLPGFLNQTAKAKQTEAKNFANSWLKGQKLYRAEFARFTEYLDLAVGLPTQTSNYIYQQDAPLENEVVGYAESLDSSLKPYSFGVEQDKTIITAARGLIVQTEFQVLYGEVVCEKLSPQLGKADSPIMSPQNDTPPECNTGHLNVQIGAVQ